MLAFARSHAACHLQPAHRQHARRPQPLGPSQGLRRRPHPRDRSRRPRRLQEALAEQYDFLGQFAPPTHLIGVCRDDGCRAGEATPILLAAATGSTSIASDTFWLERIARRPSAARAGTAIIRASARGRDVRDRYADGRRDAGPQHAPRPRRRRRTCASPRTSSAASSRSTRRLTSRLSSWATSTSAPTASRTASCSRQARRRRPPDRCLPTSRTRPPRLDEATWHGFTGTSTASRSTGSSARRISGSRRARSTARIETGDIRPITFR